ncbi:MAG: hypothetical protein JXM70_30655 [Pirellulales bacterium]|nr:hypothetical protein [Pirellulales bacterium]
MPTNTKKRSPFQFSLRTFLIVTTATGVGLGIMGRLFMRNPDIFMTVLGVLSTVVPFLLAIITIIWIGAGGKPHPAANCRQCGADLSEVIPSQYTLRRERRWGLVIWGIMLLAMPAIGLALMVVAQKFYGPSPGGLGMLSTEELIEKRLPKKVDEPWVWRELERRLQDGTLTKENVDAAVKKLVAHMKTTRPQGWDSPLNWQSEFLEPANRAGMISEDVLIALADAFHGPKPAVEPLERKREGKGSIRIDVNYGNQWQSNSKLGLVLLWDVNRILLDGKPVKHQLIHRSSNQWSGSHESQLTPGNHELTVEVECAYVDQSKMLGLDTNSLSKARWPKAIKRWKTTVSTPLKVYAAGTQLVKLSTKSADSPGPSGGVRISRFAIQGDSGETKRIVLHSTFDKSVPISLSYDVSVVIEEKTIPLGRQWIALRNNGRMSSGGQFTKPIDKISPNTKQADIILTPNAKHIEHRPEVKEIWGKKVVLRGVLLERLDLEAENE